MLVLRPAAGRREKIEELAFAPDGRALATPMYRRGVMRWTTFAPNARAELIAVPESTNRVVFASDGRLLAGGGELHAVSPDAQVTSLGLRGATWRGIEFAVSPDGSRLVVSCVQPGFETTRLTCHPTSDLPNTLWQTDVPAYTHLSPAIGADGTFVQMELMRFGVTIHWNTHRVRRSLDTGAVLNTSPPLPERIEQFALSPDGSTVAARIREFIHFMPAAGAVKFGAHVRNETLKHFTGLAFHPSGKYLAATSNDATVRLYDVATLDPVRTFTWDIGRMRSIAFSPDGTLAAAGSDSGKVVVWDVDV